MRVRDVGQAVGDGIHGTGQFTALQQKRSGAPYVASAQSSTTFPLWPESMVAKAFS